MNAPDLHQRELYEANKLAKRLRRYKRRLRDQHHAMNG